MESIKNLFRAIKNSSLSDETKDILRAATLEYLNQFVDYVEHVVRMDLFISSITEFSAVDDAKVNRLDRERSQIHNSCIDACSKLNGICREVGIAPVCDFDLNDRYQVADFCGAVVGSVFLSDRELGSFDAIIEKFELTNEPIRYFKEMDFDD